MTLATSGRNYQAKNGTVTTKAYSYYRCWNRIKLHEKCEGQATYRAVVIQLGPVHQLGVFFTYLFCNRYGLPQLQFCGLHLAFQFFELGGGFINQTV